MDAETVEVAEVCQPDQCANCQCCMAKPKTDEYYMSVLAYARSICGSYRVVAEKLGASSGPQVEAWVRNGVAYKWRPILDDKFGLAFRKLSK
jgi:hypothetical protein